MDLKIIIYQNNYVKSASMNNIAKSFDILATSLSVLHILMVHNKNIFSSVCS